MLLSRRLARPAPVTLTTVVHIPELTGFWAESLDVLKLCLSSLRATTPAPFELVVLDNGSCEEVRAELEERFAAHEIDQLLLSRRNLGKVGAWNLLFAAAGGELIAYCDSDIFFRPGWFEASRAIFGAFPDAGVVTAQAMSRDLSWYLRSTLEGATADPAVEWQEGDDLVPRHFINSHLRGLGESPESYARRIPQRRDVRLRREGVEAYVSAAHFQFLCRRDVLEWLFPLASEMSMGDVNVFDEAVDRAGFWRLSTVDYLVHHMGNRRPDLARELPWLDPSRTARPVEPRHASASGVRHRIFESRPVRRLLKAINRHSHQLLYPD